MSYGPRSTDSRPPYHAHHGAEISLCPSGIDLKKIVGVSLTAVGALFALYVVGSVVVTLVRVSLGNFGLVFFPGTINYIFWTVVFPFGGFIN